jgi:protein-L-isoaspartate(D-aspartate) O-methyltransferase
MKKVMHLVFWLILIGLVLFLFSSHVVAEPDFQRQRLALVDLIKAEVAETRDFLQQDALDDRMLNALKAEVR